MSTMRFFFSFVFHVRSSDEGAARGLAGGETTSSTRRGADGSDAARPLSSALMPSKTRQKKQENASRVASLAAAGDRARGAHDSGVVHVQHLNPGAKALHSNWVPPP